MTGKAFTIRVLGVALCGCVATTAWAERPAPESPSAFFAKKVGEALGRTVDLTVKQDDLPKVIVDLVNTRYAGAHYAGARKQNLQKLRAAAAAFSGSWKTYRRKTAQVDAALKQAKGATPAQAEAILQAVLTPPPRNGAGFIVRKRGFADPCDAEVAAVFALAKAYGAQKKYGPLVELSAHLMGCRHVGDRSEELLLYLATKSGREFANLKFGQKSQIGEAVNRMLKAAGALRGRRGQPPYSQLANAFYRALPSFGLTTVGLGDYKRVKRNAWVLMRDIFQPTVKRKALKYLYKRTFYEAYDCKRGSKIVGFNRVTGKWDYELKCKQRPVKVKASLAAKLVAPPPAWVKDAGRFQSVWVVGQVKKLGPAWKLNKATMADLRFLKWRAPR